MHEMYASMVMRVSKNSDHKTRPALFRGRSALLVLVALFLSTCVTSLASANSAVIEIKKSENDTRDYRYLTLENGLRVLLVSDTTTEKSAASMNVGVGAYQNPADRQGLAHFLEHMLFLGTEKYPQPGEYQEFIAQHGGKFNAFTAAENTNYYFDVSSEHLEGALDRFAQFFIAPLFTPEYVERERNAVNSEYVARLKDDGRRAWDVYREVMNPSHPGAKFSVGNTTTLADIEYADGSVRLVRDDMIAFYHQYYSASLMTLAVVGKQSLDNLETMVRSQFSAIKHRDVIIPANYPALFEAHRLPASVDIRPEKELRQLKFLFPIDSPDKFYHQKSYEYLTHLMGHEGRGSLLSLLKRLGWAEGINASTSLKSREDAVLDLTIELTPQGVIAKDQIVSLVFYTLDVMRERAISQWRFNELQVMSELNFRFQEKQPPIEWVTQLSQAMAIYAPQDVLRGPSVYQLYDEKALRDALAKLTNKNVIVVTVAPEVTPYRISRLYHTPFALRAGIPAQYDVRPAVRQELALPEKNPFIPQRISVKTASMLDSADRVSKKPDVILNNRHIRAWYTQDREFIQPRATINLRIDSPVVAMSPGGAVQAQLFAALVTDQLTEYAYAAKLAGIDLTVEAHSGGLDIKVFGYSARQGLLLNRVMETVRAGRFKEERFALEKQRLLRKLKNEDKELPYLVLSRLVPQIQLSPGWTNKQLIAELDTKTFDDFQRFTARHLLDAKLEAFFYGNYFKAEALKLAVLAEHELLNRQIGRAISATKVLPLSAQTDRPLLFQYPLDHPDNMVELLIQSPSNSAMDNAHLLLIRRILQPAFFHQLRTEKQLGYIVGVVSTPLADVENALFAVQSPSVSESALVKEINAFLMKQKPTLTAEWTRHRDALRNDLLEPARSLKEQGDRYWLAITNYQSQFSRRVELAAAAAQITPESLEDYYERVFLNATRRLWLSSGKLDNLNDFHVIRDLPNYKKAVFQGEQERLVR